MSELNREQIISEIEMKTKYARFINTDAVVLSSKAAQFCLNIAKELEDLRAIAEGYQKQFEDCAEDRARLTEENETIAKLLVEKTVTVIEFDKQITRLTEENDAWQKRLITEKEKADKAYYALACEVEDLRTENERLKAIPEQLHKEMSERMVEERKIERKLTVRKMQERLKERKVSYGNITFKVVPIDDIDQIAKEMVEGE